jgi:ribonuclease-3
MRIGSMVSGVETGRESVSAFAARLAIPLGAEAELTQALTHASARHQDGAAEDNERLEFLGDAVLGAVVAAHLFLRDAEANEGDLSERRAAIVSRQALADIALELGIDRALHLGESEAQRGGGRRPAALAAALEAVIGAIFLKHGYLAATHFIERHLAAALAAPRAALGKGIKTLLQEWTQARNGSLPRYDIVATHGLEHERIFECAVRVDGSEIARGSGSSRRAAEAAAAEAAIDILGITPGAAL